MDLHRVIIVVALGLPTVSACADDEAPRDDRSIGPAPPAPEPPPEELDDPDDLVGGACDEGAIRDCKVQINPQNCFVGEQHCIHGRWSECLAPEDFDPTGGVG